jgi:hypothetical protein
MAAPVPEIMDGIQSLLAIHADNCWACKATTESPLSEPKTKQHISDDKANNQ